MSLRATILGQRREAFSYLLRLLGKLSYPDHPLPRLTTAQNEILNEIQKLVAALMDLDNMEEKCMEKKVKPGLENTVVPPLPYIRPLYRIPGDRETPILPEIDCVSSIEAVNELLASGQWELKQLVPLNGYLMIRKTPTPKEDYILPDPNEPTNEESI